MWGWGGEGDVLPDYMLNFAVVSMFFVNDCSCNYEISNVRILKPRRDSMELYFMGLHFYVLYFAF